MATKQKILDRRQAAALAAMADAFLPEELRPKRRARGKWLRRVGGLALLGLAAAGLYAALRRAGE